MVKAVAAASLLLLQLCVSVPSEELTLPVTADNSICMHPSEQADNLGRSARIKMKGIENVLLLDFNASRLKGKSVTRAVLRIKGCAKNLMIRNVGFSTVATAWCEGDKTAEGRATEGESCYRSPAVGQHLWAGPGSTFLDAVWGRGGTIWSQTRVTPDDGMWYEMEFDPRLAEACAQGLSFGLVVSDDNGQTMNIAKDVCPETNFSNNYLFSREQNNAAPVFRFTVVPAEKTAASSLKVDVIPWPGGSDVETGGLEIAWPGPVSAADATATLGYRVLYSIDGADARPLPRWMLPTVPPAGERVRALLKGQPAGARVEATVEVYRKGIAGPAATGQATGLVSSRLSPPDRLDFVAPTPEAGDPPSDAVARVWAIPDGCKSNPLTGNVLEEPGIDYEGDPAGTYARANPVWSGKEKTLHLSALRGEWVAFQLICQNLGTERVDYAVKPGALKGPSELPATAIQLSRTWYQKTGPSERGWYADPLLPLKHDERFVVPDPENAVPGQTTQTVYLEWFVPKDATPGLYTGPVEVRANAGAPLTLHVSMRVFPAVIPDQTHFTWSMNAYASPGKPYGEPGSPAFNAAEQAFYVMSHLHRTCLAVLHYSHSGNYQPGTALPLTGSGKEMKVSDWSTWDRRFGPLFDGSAFSGTSREGTALDHFYLVLAEHYPTAMRDGYKWDASTWEDHWKVAGPIEEGFSQQYREQWVAVAADQMRHFAEKRWRTKFQVYLNDKYFYKQYDAKRQRRGNGVSFWLLDEPMHVADFQALAFFGRLFRAAQERSGPHAAATTAFRADVSRPQWGRDVLDRIVDLNVSGGFADFRPWLEDWRTRYGQVIWTYGSAPSSTSSALGILGQALDLYGRGVDGFVPWLTLGDEGNWRHFAATCVFYQGRPFGISGPCASLRLKAYRRAEQDVEYVWLLAQQRGLLKDDPNRLRVGDLLKTVIKAHRERAALDAQGAVIESLKGLRAEDFEALRLHIAKALK